MSISLKYIIFVMYTFEFVDIKFSKYEKINFTFFLFLFPGTCHEIVIFVPDTFPIDLHPDNNIRK